jgi:hypothetical protein
VVPPQPATNNAISRSIASRFAPHDGEDMPASQCQRWPPV